MKLIKKNVGIFSSPVMGTFVGSFALSALVFFATIAVYLENNYQKDFGRLIINTYTNSHGLSLGLFTPLLIGINTALLVKIYISINKALTDFRIAKFSASLGLVLFYFLVTLFGTLGIFYLA